jgi:DNA-binding Lrp family transcriptional regulator
MPAFLFWGAAMAKKIEIAPELIVEGRDLYENGLTSIEEIAARMKISRSTLYARMREGKWQRRRYSPSAAADEVVAMTVPAPVPAMPDGPSVEDKRCEPQQSVADKVTVEKRAALFARAFRAAEWQMDSIEVAMKQLNATPASFERSARALAMLNRSLRDVLILTKADETALANETDNNLIPRDMDQFRRELAQRIQRLVDAERRRESESPGAGTAA